MGIPGRAVRIASVAVGAAFPVAADDFLRRIGRAAAALLLLQTDAQSSVGCQGTPGRASAGAAAFEDPARAFAGGVKGELNDDRFLCAVVDKSRLAAPLPLQERHIRGFFRE